MICLYFDSFSIGTRWTAFYAGKAILSFVLYSKSVGEFCKAMFIEDRKGDDEMYSSFAKLFIPIYFILFYIGPCLVINQIFTAFFVSEQAATQEFLIPEEEERKAAESEQYRLFLKIVIPLSILVIIGFYAKKVRARTD